MDRPVVKRRDCRGRQSCCVPDCKNYHYFRHVSMHGFPKNEARRKEWQMCLGITTPITYTMKVCSAHFNKEDYVLPDYDCKRKTLRRTARPSRNLPEVTQKNTTNYEANDTQTESTIFQQIGDTEMFYVLENGEENFLISANNYETNVQQVDSISYPLVEDTESLYSLQNIDEENSQINSDNCDTNIQPTESISTSQVDATEAFYFLKDINEENFQLSINNYETNDIETENISEQPMEADGTYSFLTNIDTNFEISSINEVDDLDGMFVTIDNSANAL